MAPPSTVAYEEELDDAIRNLARHEIEDYCRRTGTVLEPKTDAYRKVGIEFIKAKIAAGHSGAYLPLPDGRHISGMLNTLPKIEPPVLGETTAAPLLAPAPLKKTAETFSEAFERYLATELDGTGADSIADYRRKVKIFTDKVGDLPLGRITDHVAIEFLDDHLLRERKVSPRTRNGYAMLFSAIYKCAMRRKNSTKNR